MKVGEYDIDYVGHEDGTTAVIVVKRGAYYEEISYMGEGGMNWDVIVRDWEQLK